jgi:hypothetical protein
VPARNLQHCADKGRLLVEYNRDVTEWSKAVKRLGSHAGTRDSDFLVLLSMVDEARAKTQRAKAAYAAHTAAHGC